MARQLKVRRRAVDGKVHGQIGEIQLIPFTDIKVSDHIPVGGIGEAVLVVDEGIRSGTTGHGICVEGRRGGGCHAQAPLVG